MLDLGGSEPQATLGKLAVALKGLALKLEGAEAPFLELPDARLTGGRLDLAKQEVEIEKLAVAGGRVRVAVDEGVTLNVERIVRDAQKPSAAPPPRAAVGAAKPWTLSLAAVDLSGFAADYQDRSRTPGLSAGVGEIKTVLKARSRREPMSRGRPSASRSA